VSWWQSVLSVLFVLLLSVVAVFAVLCFPLTGVRHIAHFHKHLARSCADPDWRSGQRKCSGPRIALPAHRLLY
jgi:hypothetical protein